jgi:hypothetical protein
MLAGACARHPAPPDLDAMASRYIQLTRELAGHDPSLVDHWLTEPPPLDAGGRRPVSTLHLAIETLGRETEAAILETSGEARVRAEWLAGQTRALRVAAGRLLGQSLPFDTEARLAFGLSPARADLFEVDRAREALERALPGTAPLGERLAAFRARFQVPAAARDAVMRAALEACREATRTDLPLPSDAAVEVAFVEGIPWDAHARYLGAHRTRIEINASAPLDLTRALRLACHEGDAGHHAQHIWMADDLVSRRGWQEHALVPGFGPALLLAEGAAEAGADLAMPPERRARVYRDRLAPAAGLGRATTAGIEQLVRVEEAQAALEPLVGDIAREYLDNQINAATAAERLRHDVLMPAPEAFVFFIERRRTRILAYTEGRRLARERLGGSGLAGLRRLFVPGSP